VSALATSSARFTVAPSASSACASVPFTLVAGAGCSVRVTWLGQAGDGSETATLTITGDMQPATATVSLHSDGDLASSSNDGGGGCTLGAGTGAADPVLLGMAAAAAFMAWRRRRAPR